jgi:hypothetical protein
MPPYGWMTYIVGRLSWGNMSIGMVLIARKELKKTAPTTTKVVTGLFNDAETRLMGYYLSCCTNSSR